MVTSFLSLVCKCKLRLRVLARAFVIFSSWQYLVFLPIVVFLYWRTAGKVRLALLIVASYFFYMSWFPLYGLLLFALTLANWLCGFVMHYHKQRSVKLALLWLGLAINLGCLAYYKYANFLIANINTAINCCLTSFLRSPPVSCENFVALNIILPLGISFFIFEFVHYLVDVYRGHSPVKSWLEFAVFAAFFPSQIAGPIKRYQDFIPKLTLPEPWSSTLFFEGMTLIVQGLFKKVAIADVIGACIFPVFVGSQIPSAADALIASIGFVIQVYADFSGYTDLGRGSALLMGIRLPENFRLPYLSYDLADFWRRWHMSLSYWLRDYVYIPLGGSKGGRLSTWKNLFITMVACGLWHGAAWHYVLFGIMQGLGLIVNREWKSLLAKVKPLETALNTWLGKISSIALTMLFITVSFAVFRAPDVTHALNLLKGLAHSQDKVILWEPLIRTGAWYFLSVYVIFWLLTEFIKHVCEHKLSLPKPAISPGFVYPAPVRFASWTTAFLLALAARPSEATPFVYFQF